jgi:hypothetical protein
LLAGPVAIVVSVLVLLAAPLWYPPGEAQVDNLVVPLVCFPLIWAALFFHACLDRRIVRAAIVSLFLGAISLALIIDKFSA